MGKPTLSTIFILVVLTASSLAAIEEGDVGTTLCGQVQELAQETAGEEDPAVYRNHGGYVRTVARLVSQFEERGDITEECSSCIVNQFARSLPIHDQTSCGPIPCREAQPAPEEVQAAVIAALERLGVGADPWGNVGDFELFLDLTEAELGCFLRDEGAATNSPLFQQQVQGCVEPGVNYCGPGTSRTNSLLNDVTVPACLNEGCCQHDVCYGVECVAEECIWTPQSQGCDNPLVSTCLGLGSCGLVDLLDPMALVVCTAVQCLNATFPAGICQDIRSTRVLLNPQCLLPPSQENCDVSCQGQTCGNFSTCNPGSGCGNPVCATISEGGGVCVEGQTPCAGLADCTTSADCAGGLCLVGTCCGRPVCVGATAFCPDIGASLVPDNQLLPVGPTIGQE